MAFLGFNMFGSIVLLHSLASKYNSFLFNYDAKIGSRQAAFQSGHITGSISNIAKIIYACKVVQPTPLEEGILLKILGVEQLLGTLLRK